MKIKLHIWVQDCGDGSPAVHFFPSLEAAEKEAEKNDQRYCDDIFTEEIEVDSDGNITKGLYKPIVW